MKRGVAQTVMFIVVLGVLLIGIVNPFVRVGGESGVRAVGDISYVILGIAATLAGVMSIRWRGILSPQGKTLFLLTVAVAFDALAGLVWAFYELGFGVLEPFPSIADAVWLMFYMFAFASLGYALWNVRRFIKPKMYVLAALLLAALASLMYYFIFRLIADPLYSPLAKAFNTFYPSADILVLTLSFLLFMTLRTGVFGRPWLLFVIGFVVYTAGDLIFANLTWLGEYHSGTLADIMYYLALVCFFYGFIKVREGYLK